MRRTKTKRFFTWAVVSSHRRERSERWQVVGVGPHDNQKSGTILDQSPEHMP